MTLLKDRPGIAILIGPADDPVAEIVQECVEFRGFKYQAVPAPEKAVRLLEKRGSLNAEVNFVFAYSEIVRDQHMEQLRDAGHGKMRIVVWAQYDDAWSALRLVGVRGRADDYWYRESYDAERLKACLDAALPGGQTYHRFALGCARNCRVFVVTPFRGEAQHDYHNGIVPALERLCGPGTAAAKNGKEYEKGDDVLFPTFLLEKIRDRVDGSGLVIANISDYSGIDNPNVYLEAGYSIGKAVPLLLVRRQSKGLPPADIRGVEYLSFHDCSELTLRLYFGLREYFD